MTLHCTSCGASKELDEARCLDCGSIRFSEPVHAQAIAETVAAGTTVHQPGDNENRCPLCSNVVISRSTRQVMNQVYDTYLPCSCVVTTVLT